MDNNIDFKDLWAKQTSVEPNPEDFYLQIKKIKKINLKSLIITNVLLTATSLFIIFIWMYYQPQFLTTKIGIVLVILAMALYVFASNKSFTLLKHNKIKNNNDYLKELVAIKNKQQFMQTTMLNLYFVLLLLGLGLYMYEYTVRMTTFWGIFAYLITTIWVLFNWFYLRPKQIKKQQSKLNEIIEKLKMLNKQMDD